MYLFFRNGSLIHLEMAKTWKIHGEYLKPQTSRGRDIGCFRLIELHGWCFDNERMTHYHSAEKKTEIAR